MKPVFTFLFLLLAFSKSQAQQVIYYEGFEYFQSYQFLGWPAQINNIYSYPWETGSAFVIGGECFGTDGKFDRVAGLRDTYKCNQCASCNGTFSDSLVTLVTPVIPFSAASGAWLSFDSYYRGVSNNGVSESATVLVSADSGATWNEVIQVTPVISPGFEARYADLSAYTGQDYIQLGFRYSDSGGHMGGWMIDNITIFNPVDKDLELRSISPTDSMLSYAMINSGIKHEFEVFNNGLDTVTSFTISYRKGGDPTRSHTVQGITLPPFQTIKIAHPYLDTMGVVGPAIVTGEVELPGDLVSSNNKKTTTVHGVHFMPQKRLVIEEGTATWIANAPRGIVMMKQAAESGIPLSLIACHGGDTMELNDYGDFLFYTGDNYLPYFLFDRRERIKPQHFFDAINKQKDYFGYANMNISSHLEGDQLTVDVTVTPALDMMGIYKLGLILTENRVHSTHPSFAQANGYGSNSWGPMNGYENMPDPIPAADMYYDNVARLTHPEPGGALPDWPADLVNNTPYHHRFQTQLSSTWNFDNLFATVVLLRDGDSTVMNSRRIDWPLSIKTNVTTSEFPASIYPNPAKDYFNLSFEANGVDKYGWMMQDISGRTLSMSSPIAYSSGRVQQSISTSGLASGMYFITVYTEHSRKTMKVQVMND